MKHGILLLLLSLLGTAAWAKEDDGAIGLGLVAESYSSLPVSTNLRASTFLDVGVRLFRPVFFGFEMQGDVKVATQDQFTLQPSDVWKYNLAGTNHGFFSSPALYETQYTLLDLALGPRLTLSWDQDDFQLLAFLGASFSWQSLAYQIHRQDGAPFFVGTSLVAPGETYHQALSLGNTFSAVAGLRASLGLWYLEYARLFDGPEIGGGSWNQTNRNRYSSGLNLRF